MRIIDNYGQPHGSVLAAVQSAVSLSRLHTPAMLTDLAMLQRNLDTIIASAVSQIDGLDEITGDAPAQRRAA